MTDPFETIVCGGTQFPSREVEDVLHRERAAREGLLRALEGQERDLGRVVGSGAPGERDEPRETEES